MAEKQYINGRKAALQTLDKVLEEPESHEALANAFREAIRDSESTLGFFRHYVMPLLPKQVSFGTDEDEDATGMSIRLEAFSPASDDQLVDE